MRKILLLLVISADALSGWSQQGERMQTATGLSDQPNARASDLFRKGQEYTNNKQYEKGIACYEQAIALDSAYIDAYNNVGLGFFETNALDSSAYYLHISLRKRAANVPALTNLGLVEEKQGNLQGAVEHFQQVIKLEPQNPEGYYDVASPLLDLGKLQEGLAAAKQAERLFEQAHSASLPDCHYLLLIAYFNLKDVPNAKKYFALCKKENTQIDPQIVAALQ